MPISTLNRDMFGFTLKPERVGIMTDSFLSEAASERDVSRHMHR